MMSEVENEPAAALEYVSVAAADSLVELELPTDVPLLLSLSVRFGTTHLIDNQILPPPEP
jgi:pantothenate synthetase